MAQQQPSARSLIWRNGLIFGGIIIVIALIDVFTGWKLGAYDIGAQLTPRANADPFASLVRPSALIGYGAGLVEWALYFIAGMLTARKTGTVGSGALTGLVAAVFGALVGGAISVALVITVIAPQIQVPATSAITQSQLTAIIIGGAILGLVVGSVFGGAIGAGLGALGGLVGRSSYQKANPPQAYQQSFYGAPAGGYAPPPDAPQTPPRQS